MIVTNAHVSCARISNSLRSHGYATCVASLPKRLHTHLKKEVLAGGCKLAEIRAKYTAVAKNNTGGGSLKIDAYSFLSQFFSRPSTNRTNL